VNWRQAALGHAGSALGRHDGTTTADREVATAGREEESGLEIRYIGNQEAPDAQEQHVMRRIRWGNNSLRTKQMARPERFELPTPWFVAKSSIQLSYGRA